MLLNTFFFVKTVATDSAELPTQPDQIRKFSVKAEINPSHPIFQGHFPGNPVVPGVCEIHMITEILELIHKKQYRLTKADTIKFLSLINPTEICEVVLELSCRYFPDDSLAVQATIVNGSTVYLKFKGYFQVLSGETSNHTF